MHYYNSSYNTLVVAGGNLLERNWDLRGVMFNRAVDVSAALRPT